MEFEWDEAKRLINLEKHGIDFRRATKIWQRGVIDPHEDRINGFEIRHIALGIIGDDARVIAVVYTKRDGKRRIISARRARRNERQAYQSQFGYGD
jgi:hypothetical protein